MMRRRLFLAAPVAVPTLARAAERLHTVATFSVLADLLHQVGGELVEVTSLVPVDGDVHVYQPRPADLRAVLGASLLVENGLGLEGWMQRLTGAAAFTGKRVIATLGVLPRTLRKDGGTATVDPHAWQDPRNGVIYVRNIVAGLIAADPANAASYQSAAERYTTAIGQSDDWMARQFAAIPREWRRIVTTHDAFGYFGARYGIDFLAPEGISTDSEPSARDIAALVAQIKREQIRAVFIENMTDPRMARMLAQESGARVGGTVYSDSLSVANGPAPTYLAMFRHNTEQFIAAMGDHA